MDAEVISVTVERACAVSGLGRTSIYELIKEGKLASSVVKGRRLVLYASLKDLVHAHQVSR